MKRIKHMKIKKAFFVAFLIAISLNVFAQNVAINTTGFAPDASSMLDIVSTDGGILIPRMTLAQRDAINSGTFATGLLIYQTDNTAGFYYYDGSAWSRLVTSSAAYVFENALTESAGTVKFGGALTGATTVTLGTNNMVWNLDNSGTFDIQEGGSSAFFVNTNGRIGMGINSPSYRLDLRTDESYGSLQLSGATGSYFVLSDDNAPEAIFITSGIDDESLEIKTLTAGADIILRSNDGSASNLIIKDNGNVEIGGSTPDDCSILEITATDKGLLIPRVALTGTSDATTITGVETTSLLVYNTATAGGVTPGFYYWDGSNWKAIGTTGGSGTNDYVARWTPDGATLGTGLIRDNGSSVAINGVPSIHYTLLNNGNFYNSGIFYTNGNSTSYPTTDDGFAVSFNFSSGKNDISLWNTYTRANATDQAFVFRQKNGPGANREIMTLMAQGNVGIGTSTPFSKLDVEGGITVGSGYSGSFAAPAEGMLIQGAVGIGTAPTAKLSVSIDGTPLGGTATSSTFNTMAGALGTAANADLAIANIGYTSANETSFGIHAFRRVANGAWNNSNIIIGMDVDNSPRAGGWISIGGDSRIGIMTAFPTAELDVGGTGAIKVPVGTTAQRPGTATQGMIRYNTSTSHFEGYNGSSWNNLD